MKTAFSLSFLAMLSAALPVLGQQNYGVPGYPPVPPPPTYGAPAAGAGIYGATPYTPVQSSLPAPVLGSPYTGPNMMNPAPAPATTGYGGYDYSYQQPTTQTNAWGAVQQSVGAASLLNYNYVEAGYRYVDPKGGSFDGSHGLGVTLVMDLPTIFFLKASLNWSSGNANSNTVAGAANADYDLSTISIGGGAFMAITQKLHFVGEVGLIYANFDADGINKSYTDAGIYIRPSLRYQVIDWLELQAGVTVTSTDDYDSKILDIGGYFRVMPQFDLNLGADIGDENRTLKAGARLRW